VAQAPLKENLAYCYLADEGVFFEELDWCARRPPQPSSVPQPFG
jgi:hypothetical protein